MVKADYRMKGFGNFYAILTKQLGSLEYFFSFAVIFVCNFYAPCSPWCVPLFWRDYMDLKDNRL